MNIVETIAERTKLRVKEAKSKIPLLEVREYAQLLSKETMIDFPFEKAIAREDVSFICECKKASPSKGIINPHFPYIQIAKEYEEAGAACLSVLTEPDWFQGNNRYLTEIASSVRIPCLRKDFTVDEYMIYEAKTIGASAVLLICSLLETGKIAHFISICDELGLSALVEAHDEKEIQSALQSGARIIGVNNRNLKDFSVDIQNSIKLRKLVPDHILFIAESGIKTAEEVARLKDAHVNGVLIGESLMKAKDKKAFIHQLRGL